MTSLNQDLFFISTMCMGMDLLLHIAAYIRRTNYNIDLGYALTFLTVCGYVIYTRPLSWAGYVVADMIIIWALRMGGFLFWRLHRQGRDQRFDCIPGNNIRSLRFGLLQGISVVIIAGPAIVWWHSPQHLTAPGYIGIGLWFAGFIMQALADIHKSVAKSHDPARPVQSGLYALCQHPHFIGEILMWVGISCIALPMALAQKEILQIVLVILGPTYVWALVRYVNIPSIDATHTRTYANDVSYRAYRQKTPLLFPRFLVAGFIVLGGIYLVLVLGT